MTRPVPSPNSKESPGRDASSPHSALPWVAAWRWSGNGILKDVIRPSRPGRRRAPMERTSGGGVVGRIASTGASDAAGMIFRLDRARDSRPGAGSIRRERRRQRCEPVAP